MANIELVCYRKNILNNFHTKSALLEIMSLEQKGRRVPVVRFV